MSKDKISELEEIYEELSWGEVIEFRYNEKNYAFESYQLDGDDFHSLCLYTFNDGDSVGTLVFADKITYFGVGDYPNKFDDNYPVDEIKAIIEKEKVFNGKNFVEIYDSLERISVQ